MNKKKYEFSKKFKKFINDSIYDILITADLPSYTYSVSFRDSLSGDVDGRGHGTQAEIDVLLEYQSFAISIYKNLEEDFKKGFTNKIYDVLCHEIGHIHTERLYGLAYEPYKSEEEVRKANEEAATKIGGYLFRLRHKK